MIFQLLYFARDTTNFAATAPSTPSLKPRKDPFLTMLASDLLCLLYSAVQQINVQTPFYMTTQAEETKKSRTVAGPLNNPYSDSIQPRWIASFL
jgi:hypothetical protein